MNAVEISTLHSSLLTRITFAVFNTVGNCKPIIGLKFLMSVQKKSCFLRKESIAVSLVKKPFSVSDNENACYL